jgi:lipoprotein-anchoring transpeptidase ErfK/SrfK
VRRFALILLALVLAASAAGAAGAQTPPPAPPPVPPPPVEPLVPAGVTIAGVAVGGMTRDLATQAVQAAFDQPIPFRFRERRWKLRPETVRSYAYVRPAVGQALKARPGAKIALGVRIHLGRVRRYASSLDRLFSQEARDSRLLFRNLRPFITKARAGRKVDTGATTNAIARALARTERTQIVLKTQTVAPRLTRRSFGPIIVIRRDSRRLFLYRNMTFVRSFPIAVGQPAYPTPLGRYHVISRERHPTWDPPSSPWAAGLGPVPPGPANPLGTRWIGTSAPAIGIHGTPQPWTVGTAASHGCIRMYMRDVEWLFERVRVGSPVFIVRA